MQEKEEKKTTPIRHCLDLKDQLIDGMVPLSSPESLKEWQETDSALICGRATDPKATKALLIH